MNMSVDDSRDGMSLLRQLFRGRLSRSDHGNERQNEQTKYGFHGY